MRAALESLTILPDDLEQPCWIGAAGTDRPNPHSLLPAQNGLFELATGRLLPPTPDFFNCNAVPYDYDPKAPRPFSSPIGQFVADRCIVDPEATVPKVEIYSAWKSWCEESGHVSGSDANFAKSLLASVTGLGDARPVQGNLRVRVWVGVRLRTYLDDEADERTEASKERHGPSKEAVHAKTHEKKAPSRQSNQKHTTYAHEEHLEEGAGEREEVGDAIGNLPGRPGRGGRGLADENSLDAVEEKRGSRPNSSSCEGRSRKG